MLVIAPLLALAVALVVPDARGDAVVSATRLVGSTTQGDADGEGSDAAEGFPTEFDIVIPYEELEEHQAAVARDPEAYDGLVVGVLPPKNPSPDVAAVALGGAAAEAVDERIGQLQAEGIPQAVAPPICQGDPQEDSSAGVFLTCKGHEPEVVFVAREIPDDAPVQERIAGALDALTESTPLDESALGLYSLLEGMDNPVLGVEVVGGLAVVNFDGSVRDLGLEEIFAGTIFIEQVVATVLEFDAITQAELRLEGSCEEMDRALSGVGCTRYDQTERESFQQFQQEESR